jgi:stage II sporulation protein AA (anti-sigma F factor antagonist)
LSEHRLQVRSRDVGSTGCVVTTTGELDHETRDQLSQILHQTLSRGRHHIAVDLSPVTFCDSAALTQFVETHRETSSRGGWLRLVGAEGAVLAALQSTALDRYFTLCTTLDEALEF